MTMIGKRFGRLEVLSFRNEITETGVKSYAKVKCSCGVVKEITRSNLYRTKSCGCLREEVRKKQIKALRKLGHVWVYKGKKYRTNEMVEILHEMFGGQIKKSTVSTYLRMNGLKPTLRRAKSYSEQRGRKVSLVDDKLGFTSVTELIGVSGLSRQGFYNKINAGYKPKREMDTIVWTK